MATRRKKVTKKKKTTKRGGSRAVVKYDERMAEMAKTYEKQEARSGGGSFFSTRGGHLSFDGAPLPDNQMAVVVLDHVHENTFYPGKFNPEEPQAPSCYAFGRDEAEMSPHEMVIEANTAVSESCVDCPNNEWGSSDTGRGKACKNQRRLALIPAGTLDKHGNFEVFDEPDHWKTAEVAYLKLPVMSVKGFGGFVKQVASTLRRPPLGIFTRVQVVPDDKSQFRVVFTPIGKVPDKIIPQLMERHEEVKNLIEFPYAPVDGDEISSSKRGRKKKTTKRRTTKKRARAGARRR